MERLTKSPYITSVYGLCGVSQITEYSEGGNIHDRIKEARVTRSDAIPSIEKLKIGFQIASAVADMHTFEPDGVTSLVHMDICCHQFVLIDSVYKLGDFHLSAFTRKQKETGEVCLEYADMKHPKVNMDGRFAKLIFLIVAALFPFEAFSHAVASLVTFRSSDAHSATFTGRVLRKSSPRKNTFSKR